MQHAAMTLVADSIAASDYEGWVAYLGDGTPIYEEVRHSAKRGSLIRDGIELAARPADRQTMEWRDLPMDRIWRVELYFARGRWGKTGRDQPVCQIDRVPDDPDFRFIQFKRASKAVVSSKGLAAKRALATSGPFHQVRSDLGAADRLIREYDARRDHPSGQIRTGLYAYVMGYYTTRSPTGSVSSCVLVEFTKAGKKNELGERLHPCLSKRSGLGFGLSPDLLDMEAPDVASLTRTG